MKLRMPCCLILLLGQTLPLQANPPKIGVVQQNMQSPIVQALYKQHLSQGGKLNFEQFVYYYTISTGLAPDIVQNKPNASSTSGLSLEANPALQEELANQPATIPANPKDWQEWLQNGQEQ